MKYGHYEMSWIAEQRQNANRRRWHDITLILLAILDTWLIIHIIRSL